MAEHARPPVLARGELGGAVFAAALVASMFAVKWFGVDGLPTARGANVRAEDAWNGLSVVRWLILLTAIVLFGSIALHVAQRTHGTKTDTSLLLAALATVTAASVVWRVLINLPDPGSVVDQKLGAMAGVACALGTAMCSWQTVREFRSRRGPRASEGAPA